MADGQISQRFGHDCCCTSLRLVPGCEDGLNTFLILAPLMVRVQEETNKEGQCDELSDWIALVGDPEQ